MFTVRCRLAKTMSGAELTPPRAGQYIVYDPAPAGGVDVLWGIGESESGAIKDAIWAAREAQIAPPASLRLAEVVDDATPIEGIEAVRGVSVGAM